MSTATPATKFDRFLAPYVCPTLPSDKRERSHRKVDGTPKVGYADWRRAAAEARSMTLRGLGQLRTYRCPECHKWHIGNVEPRPNGPLAVAVIDPALPELATPPAPTPMPEAAPMPEPKTPKLAQRVGADLFRRVQSAQALIEQGQSISAACRTAKIGRSEFRSTQAALEAGAVVVNAPTANGHAVRHSPRKITLVPLKETPPSGPSDADLLRYGTVLFFNHRSMGLSRALEAVGVTEAEFRAAFPRRYGPEAQKAVALVERLGPAPFKQELLTRAFMLNLPKWFPVPPEVASVRAVYRTLYTRFSARHKEPEWQGVPQPYLRDGKPVIRVEHLRLLSDDERRRLFAKEVGA